MYVHLDELATKKSTAGRPANWVFVQQCGDQAAQAGTVPRLVNWLISSVDDPEDECIQRISGEGMLQRAQLVQDTAQ